MKKHFLVSTALCAYVLASDPVTIDSLFKTQNGVRGITTVSFVSSGSQNTYAIYPELMSENDGRVWNDTKSVSLSQTILYGVSKNLDAMMTASGSYKRKEYMDFGGYKNDNSSDFDSLWLGGIYSFGAIGDFKPQFSAQVSGYQKKRYREESKGVTANSAILKASLKNYSDPVVSTFSLGTTINGSNTIGSHKVEDGNQIFFGLDMSIILSPKVSLDIGLDQRYQMEAKTDGAKVSNSKSIPTMALGATYVLTPKASVSISGSAGGSSDAPDSIFSVSLWQKF